MNKTGVGEIQEIKKYFLRVLKKLVPTEFNILLKKNNKFKLFLFYTS